MIKNQPRKAPLRSRSDEIRSRDVVGFPRTRGRALRSLFERRNDIQGGPGELTFELDCSTTTTLIQSVCEGNFGGNHSQIARMFARDAAHEFHSPPGQLAFLHPSALPPLSLALLTHTTGLKSSRAHLPAQRMANLNQQ